MKIRYLCFYMAVLFVSPVLASEQNLLWNWTEKFYLKSNVVVVHTPDHVQFDTEIATQQICIPKGSEYKNFIYQKSLNLLTHVSREEFIQHLIDCELYEVASSHVQSSDRIAEDIMLESIKKLYNFDFS